ncbi:copper type II ascorbate-dependent monooxygenase domain protein [Dictyocaulus viviparus]|uniref:Copper type II ascorbate-dependent monooxygenase domain protein n=1 Tax=Dictyocaulus viviparus TaxID=29172 RepID=A0A0D8Y1P4_DICVI|nr:copper type II ascorbate-dependent monooxygenase domain protein [Dictyocaulus viviparus]
MKITILLLALFFGDVNCHGEDGYIDGDFRIQIDRSQDCFLEDVSENKFQFRRRFTTCDPKDYAFERGTTQFIIAGGDKFTRDFKNNIVRKDMKFGLLFDTDHPNPPEESEQTHFKILADDAYVSHDVTTYWCVIKKVPEIVSKQKHHITKIMPHIQKGNEHLVHHMEPVYYPPEAGRPIGGKGGHKYLKVEIHYNNPEMLTDIIDNSGIDITITKKLRKYDAGIMELGLIYSDANSIPPGQSAFTMTGYCVADCTNKLPEQGIHIFATQLHAHMSGRKLFTSHYRHGVKIGEINRDNHYSPHWQHVVHLQPYVHVFPGDVLTTTCVYETRSQNNVVLGGYGIEDEMCVNYIYYYPLSDIEVCKSAIDNNTLHDYFEHQHGIKRRNLPIHEKYKSIEWNTKNTLSLKEIYAAAPLNMHCLKHDGKLFPGHPLNWTGIPQPYVHKTPITPQRDDYECSALND